MDKKPSLQEYLKNNPSKGLNDYYEEYGHIETPPPVEPQYTPPQQQYTPPPPQQQQQYIPPTQQQPVYHDAANSYLPPPKKKKDSSISPISIIGGLLVLAGIALPWISVETLPKLFEKITTINGYQMPDSITKIFDVSSSLIYQSIYMIPLGGLLAILGEFTRNWALRIFGQVLVVCFGIYWIYTLMSSHGHITDMKEGLKVKDLELFKYLQYGTYITLGGIFFFCIEIIRTMFGKL